MPDRPLKDELRVVPIMSLGHEFITGDDVPPGMTEHYLRDLQNPALAAAVRPLTGQEVDTLVKNGNTADNWANLQVDGSFNPRYIRNCEFYGLVRIGKLEEVFLEYHDMHVPVGLTNSRIIACDIGDDCAVHNVPYLAHYILGQNVILLNIDEMHTTNYAKFGNGIVKVREEESVRVYMDLINECSGRRIMPFDGMTAGDAYIWSKYRADAALMERLKQITQRAFDPRRGFYGMVGDRSVIKNCGIIKDVKIGPHAYIKGANKLKNLTINSSRDEPSQIGEGVEMVNGIVGLGCHVFYGCKAVRFVMGNGSSLKYGARLIHSYLGDNSTISCCEVLNNLIFPCHEQHHNNSFLIAALVKGQSNMAANATIGSNHNSRAPDGELIAGRGFWPGLCVSVKHNCRLASFTLLTKGDYPAEMDIALPFSLLSNDTANDRLMVMPAYWWLYNMYALVRNADKFAARDARLTKVQKIEFDYLAPDTVEEIFTALRLLERWVGQAKLRSTGADPDQDDAQVLPIGRALLRGPVRDVQVLQVIGESMERSLRPVVIQKAHQAYAGYRQMLCYYGVKNLLEYLGARPSATLESMKKDLAAPRQRDWVNLGGQLVLEPDLAQVQQRIRQGQFQDWPAIHQAWDALWQKYPLDKQRHAYAALLDLLEIPELTSPAWDKALAEAVAIGRHIAQQVYHTRKKDFEDPFRRMAYSSEEEMQAVLGTAEDNAFVKRITQVAETFAKAASHAPR
ncbi:MAG: DUF4954 family protein [Planctomycetaceae bacterium]|nr:DUF4954 family protein [Planctomycetaceae bacterium]